MHESWLINLKSYHKNSNKNENYKVRGGGQIEPLSVKRLIGLNSYFLFVSYGYT